MSRRGSRDGRRLGPGRLGRRALRRPLLPHRTTHPPTTSAGAPRSYPQRAPPPPPRPVRRPRRPGPRRRLLRTLVDELRHPARPDLSQPAPERRMTDYLGHQGDINRLTTERDGAYRERAHLLALLAALHPSVIAPAPDVDEDGWQILYLTSGGTQASWHMAPRDADLCAHVEHVPADDRRAQWDGHTTEQKYTHIGQHASQLYAEARSRAETR